jgi:hypothetical protein
VDAVSSSIVTGNGSANTTATVASRHFDEANTTVPVSDTETFYTAPSTATSDTRLDENVREAIHETVPTHKTMNPLITATLHTRPGKNARATTQETKQTPRRQKTITLATPSTTAISDTRGSKKDLATIHKLRPIPRGHNTIAVATPHVNAPSNHKYTMNTVIQVPSVCKEPNCMEFLNPSEKVAIKACENKVAKYMKGYKMKKSTCKFLQDENRLPVALSSQEGSGNTWVRGLLERATGLCTGFNWGCDVALRAQGFLGEGIRSGRVLVIKTHIRKPKWKGEVWKGQPLIYEPYYQSAVLILRHPALAVIADYNRRKSPSEHDSHTHVVSPSLFATEVWMAFFTESLDAWRTRMITWVIENDATRHPVHVVRYEDLQKDTVGEVEKILDFLNFDYVHEDIVEKLKGDFTDFKRSHNQTSFRHFSDKQKEQLRGTLTELWGMAKDRGKAELLRFDEYIDALDDIY